MISAKNIAIQLVILIAAGALTAIAASYFPEYQYLWVGFFGLCVGTSELISRYRDAPERALLRPAAWLYVGINVLASVGALRLMVIYNWLATTGQSAEQLAATRVLTAGFSAMAVFRSSLFITRVGNQDVQIGPITFLQVILGAADRSVDRDLGARRAEKAEELMAGVDFEKAATRLPLFCNSLLQNFSTDDQKVLANDLATIRDSKTDDQTKSMALGLKMMNAVGAEVLEAAVKALAAQIRNAAVVQVNNQAALSLKIGDHKQIVAVALDSTGKPIDGKTFVWSSSDANIASVDALGDVTAIAAGAATISAQADGAITGSIGVTVTP
jgi:hypothetical protein